MTVSSTTTKNSYSGDGSTTTFAYAFKIFADADLTVILRSAAGTETVQTLTTNYTVTNAGNASGGNVVFVTAPASGVTVVIRRNMAQTQSTDYTANDPFPAESHEDALDRLTFIAQQQQEEVDRSIKLSRTNTMTSTEFTVGASDRANKILAFDGSGEISVTQELGTYRGTDTTTTTEAYVVRDIIKSTTAGQLNNVYICVADAVVGDLLTDTDHFELLVDAVSAATSATNAANSASAASTSATNASNSASTAETHKDDAETAKTAAETAQTNAETAQTAAEAAQAAAELAFDNFDDIYLGAKASDPSVDNDGNALNAGDLYFNTTSNNLKVYTGSAWADAALTAANFLTVANNLSDLNNAGTARTNLGLGTAATSASTDFVAVTGDAMTGNLTLGDNNKAIFGEDSDLQIYHDESNSIIKDAGTGRLQLLSNRLDINKSDGTEGMASFIEDAQVILYYDNNVKFQTTSHGISVTGSAIASTQTAGTVTGTTTADFDTYQNFVWTLTGNVTLDNPSTEKVGQSGFITFIQDGTGGRTVSLGTDYETAGGAGLTLSSAASATDVVPYIVVASGRILLGTPQLAFS
jgi:hypothetical protein